MGCGRSYLSAALIVSGAVAAAAIGLSPRTTQAQAISFSEQIAPIIAERCTVCHSANPTQRGYITAPNGVAFDEPEQIKEAAVRINLWAVVDELMPLLNETNMTDEERDLLGAWIEAGADITN